MADLVETVGTNGASRDHDVPRSSAPRPVTRRRRTSLGSAVLDRQPTLNPNETDYRHSFRLTGVTFGTSRRRRRSWRNGWSSWAVAGYPSGANRATNVASTGGDARCHPA